MNSILHKRITQITRYSKHPILLGAKIGLEKECLRVSTDGKIAQTAHPETLGSALTHPYITTDYSEALLELITPPQDSIASALEFLQATQQFVVQKLQDERLWPTSMPCIVTGGSSIPIAQYGKSNPGLMKTIYRRGLGHRYGRMMQVIAGIHFNYSLPEEFWPIYQQIEKNTAPTQDFISASYFAMIRNLQRFGWLIPYLFGASPTVCKSFIDGLAVGLEEFDENTYYQPYATSLRVGDIGYQNFKEGESGIKANYDNIDSYVESLRQAINTPCPEYEKIGVKVNGKYKQLNANLLQIENEYYSSTRPKQIAQRDEQPSLALKHRGVKYVELRSLDLNVFHPLGIEETQLHFLETFMIFCLLQDSPIISQQERKEIDFNQSCTAHHGRQPQLQLLRNGDKVLLSEWGHEIGSEMLLVAEILDQQHQCLRYSAAVKQQLDVLRSPNTTPSARIIAEMRDLSESFFPFSMRYSQKYYRHFKSSTNNIEASKAQSENQPTSQFFEKLSRQTLQKQRELESNDNLNFDQYLKNYFSQK